MMDITQAKLNTSWHKHLAGEFDQPYMRSLNGFLQQEAAAGKCIYPKTADVFAAFEHTPLDKLRIVILGQDPYHGEGQAHGLSFSVPETVAIPPSLLNIYKEIQADIYQGQVELPSSGNLQAWAEQGVLLLNSVLSVEAHEAASHQGKGWEQFTDKVIDVINQQTEHVVFMLWGAYAQKKGRMIDRDRHLVLSSPHPSPLSAYRGFFGCKHFSQANEYLVHQKLTPIQWFK